MGERTGIAWTDCTWNPVRGCSRISRGCERCYAEKIAARFSDVGKPFHGFASIGQRKGAHGWTGKVELVPEKLEEPLHWRKPRRVFVNSMSDLFHEKLSLEEIAAVFGVMAVTPHLTYQILTKRPARMLGWFREMGITARRYSERGEVNECHRRAWQAGNEEVAVATSRPASVPWPLPNVWLGVSVEDQKTADERIPLLLEVPAAVRFVSYEPALGPVRFDRIATEELGRLDALRGFHFVDGHNEPISTPRLNWLIVGGESGPKARPFDIAWARSVVAQCKAAGVACFVKQLGARPIPLTPMRLPSFDAVTGRRHRGWIEYGHHAISDPAGADPAEWPEDLRVREFPRLRQEEGR